MHSSRMRTACLLPVFPSIHCSQGVCLLRGIGGSRGGREGRTPPPWASKFFRFHAVFGKIWRVHAPPGGFTPPLGKILDPPLRGVSTPGGMFTQRGCLLPWGCLLGEVSAQITPRGQNSWHTLLKILPCPNFVAGGKNEWILPVELNTKWMHFHKTNSMTWTAQFVDEFPGFWTQSKVKLAVSTPKYYFFHPGTVANPGFPRGGGDNSAGGGAPTYDFANFPQKLHEIERIWIPGGLPSRPLRSATGNLGLE